MRRALAVLAVAIACSDSPPPEPVPEPAPPPEPAPVQVPAAFDAALVARGRAVHEQVCAECHTVTAPPLTAPTLREIADRYRENFLDPMDAIGHLADYVRQPAPGTSQLPQVMIDEWGVMPPQAVAPDDRVAVGYFIWHLPEIEEAEESAR